MGKTFKEDLKEIEEIREKSINELRKKLNFEIKRSFRKLSGSEYPTDLEVLKLTQIPNSDKLGLCCCPNSIGTYQINHIEAEYFSPEVVADHNLTTYPLEDVSIEWLVSFVDHIKTSAPILSTENCYNWRQELNEISEINNLRFQIEEEETDENILKNFKGLTPEMAAEKINKYHKA